MNKKLDFLQKWCSTFGNLEVLVTYNALSFNYRYLGKPQSCESFAVDAL